MKSNIKKDKIVIIGAGPAGLGCGLEMLENKSLDLLILDKNDTPGGLARSYFFKGHYFDIGPHRFFTKNKEVERLWKKLLGRDFIKVSRLTRMHYRTKLFLYPVKLGDVVKNLGLLENSKSFMSFAKAKTIGRRHIPKNFEEYIIKNFGKRLYTHFFKTYTEKVWGISGDEIGVEWADQRIKNLNFFEVVKTAIFGEKKRNAKSLVDHFYYPKKGAGQLYQIIASKIKKLGGKILYQTEVTQILHQDKKITKVTYKNGAEKSASLDYLFSSMPLTDFIFALSPRPEKKIIDAARKLYFRDHITVNLIVNKTDLFPDNWIYVHSPEVKMARVTNYNNFSSEKAKTSAIAVEYFVFQKDKLWKMSDKELIELAKDELEKAELVKKIDIIDGFVIKEKDSYPTYYLGHKPYFEILKSYVSKFENLQLIGRGGMYKYNNQDHAIYSGILAARNFLAGRNKYNVWAINEDAEYLEEKK